MMVHDWLFGLHLLLSFAYIITFDLAQSDYSKRRLL